MGANYTAAVTPQDATRPRSTPWQKPTRPPATSAPKPADPPPETLLVLDRGDKETRIKLASYQGHPYVSLETWAKNNNGQTVPTGRTVSLRMRDLPAVVHVLSSLLEPDVVEVEP